MNKSRPFDSLSTNERRSLLVPAAYVAIVLEFFILFQSLNPRLELAARLSGLVIGLLVMLYTVILFRFLYQLTEKYPVLQWPIAVLNGVGLAIMLAALPEIFIVSIDILALILITVSAMLFGRWPTYTLIAVSSILGGYLVVSRYPLDVLEWSHILALPLVGIMVNETMLRLGRSLSAKVWRMEMLNQVSRKIASTIEAEEVMGLVRAAVQDAFHADTYYVGLLHENCIRLEMFYDEGELYPKTDIPLGNSVVGWVIQNQKSILMRNLPVEVKNLGIQTTVVGKPKSSLSWMGAPLISGNRVLGVMAVASYKLNAFDQNDLDLLENMAHQAAMAIDHSQHHAEVVRQARLDGLTQVYNRTNFMRYLEELCLSSRLNHTPLSLVMLDVDHFKSYNDTYGHLVGDQALTSVVEAIRLNIRSSDILGRWGGEEFVILLPYTSAQQTVQVAERVRQTLKTITVTGRDSQAVPAPTVSQGIATLSEAGDANQLLDLADQRLYRAKARGRDQVEMGDYPDNLVFEDNSA